MRIYGGILSLVDGSECWEARDWVQDSIPDIADAALNDALVQAKCARASFGAYAAANDPCVVVAADLQKALAWVQANRQRVTRALPAGVTYDDVVLFLQRAQATCERLTDTGRHLFRAAAAAA